MTWAFESGRDDTGFDRPPADRDAVVVATARTPIGRAVKGSLASVRPDDLAAGVDGLVLVLVPDAPDGALAARLARLYRDAPGRAYLAGTVRRRQGETLQRAPWSHGPSSRWTGLSRSVRKRAMAELA